MNEQELFQSIIHDSIVDDDALLIRARTQPQRDRLAWRRVLIPVLTALIVGLGLVMAIPSARAEVLSWFTPRSTKEYLAAEAGQRDPVPELDAMVSSACSTDIRINYVADEPYWREIGEGFSATLINSIYDGEGMYITVDFDGLSGYPVFENERCPSIPAGALLPTYLAEKVDPEAVHHFFEDDADVSAYRNGTLELWNGPFCDLVLTTEDGAALYGRLEQSMRSVDTAFVQAFHDRYGFHESYDEETAVAWREACWAHCRTHGARAVADVAIMDGLAEHFYPDHGKTVADYLDENGCLTLHVRYRVTVPHGETTETKLDVELGTVTVDMKAYKTMPTRSIEAPTASIALSGDAVFEGLKWETDGCYTVTNYAVSLDGVQLSVSESGYVDLLGIHEVGIAVSMPEDWDEVRKEAFARSLDFDVLIDGERLSDSMGGGVERGDDGSYVLRLDISEIPFDRIGDMRTVSLIPTLSQCTQARIMQTLADGSESLVETVPLGPGETFDTARFERGTPIQFESALQFYPEWTITLKIN